MRKERVVMIMEHLDEMDIIRTFYDPYPGIGGPIRNRMSEKVKQAADQLNGKSMTLREAIAQINNEVGGAGDVAVVWNLKFLTYNFVDDRSDGYIHFFRVIRFR